MAWFIDQGFDRTTASAKAYTLIISKDTSLKSLELLNPPEKLG
jgi:hypothetical protein